MFNKRKFCQWCEFFKQKLILVTKNTVLQLFKKIELNEMFVKFA